MTKIVFLIIGLVLGVLITLLMVMGFLWKLYLEFGRKK